MSQSLWRFSSRYLNTLGVSYSYGGCTMNSYRNALPSCLVHQSHHWKHMYKYFVKSFETKANDCDSQQPCKLFHRLLKYPACLWAQEPSFVVDYHLMKRLKNRYISFKISSLLDLGGSTETGLSSTPLTHGLRKYIRSPTSKRVMATICIRVYLKFKMFKYRQRLILGSSGFLKPILPRLNIKGGKRSRKSPSRLRRYRLTTKATRIPASWLIWTWTTLSIRDRKLQNHRSVPIIV